MAHGMCSTRHRLWRSGLRTAAIMLALAAIVPGALSQSAFAQDAPPVPDVAPAAPEAATPPPATAPDPVPETTLPAPDGNITVVPRTGVPVGEADASSSTEPVPVRFEALLTSDGQRIEDGLVWRVYENAQAGAVGKLLSTKRDATPVIPMKPGEYLVNAAFGRAHLTRRITVAAKAGASPATEQFVLNAGGLRVTTLIGNKAAPPGSISYSVYTDRDQTDERRQILSGAKPGLVIRLNAGIYHIVSTYGDANAVVRSDVTVEAGKLTEATLVHTFARVAFKLVSRSGGEALPGTHWTI